MSVSRGLLCALAAAGLLAACLLPGTALAGQALEVEIRGLSGELESNARAALSLHGLAGDDAPNTKTLKALHKQAPYELGRALEPFGYYKPVIKGEFEEPSAAGQPLRAIYTVEPGPPLPIGSLDITLAGPEGARAMLDERRADLPIAEGDPLDHRRYENAKRGLVRAFVEEGYLKAELTEHKVEVNLERYEAAIAWRLETGPRYVFGDISFEQDRFNPEYLARYLVIEPGQPFSNAALAQQRRAISRSGHFKQVDIEQLPATDGPNPAIPLRMLLETYPPNRLRARFGWGTDTGIGVAADWNRRFIGSRGHRFNLGGAAVEERNRLAADFSYTIPLNPLERSRMEFVARHESKDLTYEDVDLEEGGETRIATNLLSAYWHLAPGQLGAFSVDYRPGVSFVNESYDVFEVLFGNLPREAQEAIIESIGVEAYDTLSPEFEAVTPNIRFTFRRRDDPLYIRTGDLFDLTLLGAHKDLGSNITFWQADLRTWHIRPVFDSGRFLARTAFGYSDADSREVLGVTFNQMPEYYEFRAGGVRSVRGYGFETLFPSDGITGGKHQIVASLEYEHEVIPDWSVAGFVDAGNAFNDIDDFEEKVGVGIGVRWRSPVGLARIDLGIPLDDADDSFQVHITVGPEF